MTSTLEGKRMRTKKELKQSGAGVVASESYATAERHQDRPRETKVGF